MSRRTDRLNSLLKEVITEVIRKEVKQPNISPLFTISRVEITKDLRHAKVYVSVIGTEEEKKKTIQALSSASGFIGVCSAKKVRMRFFPKLTFYLDESVDKQMRIQEILEQIHDKENLGDDKELL